MAVTQADIDRLNAAIRSGEQTVSYSGRSVTFRSVEQLIKARDDAQSELAASRPGRRRLYGFRFKTLRGD
jgi:hypothetical protein